MSTINQAKIFFIFVVVLMQVVLCNAVDLQFKFKKGQKYRIEARIDGVKIINSSVPVKYTQTYKTIEQISDVIDNGAFFEAEYYYLINYDMSGDIGLREISDVIRANYQLDNKGLMIASAKTDMPTMRSVPMFKSGDTKVGDKWIGNAFEYQEIFNDGVISVLPLEVDYEYRGVLDNSADVSIIKYEYQYDYVNDGSIKLDPRVNRISCKTSNVLYFNHILGIKVKEEYVRSFRVVLAGSGGDLSVVNFDDSGVRNYYLIETMDKDKLKKDIETDIKSKKLADVDVKKDEGGIKISLENIQFEPDSSILMESEKKRLDTIAEIIAKYKENGTKIVGHTTDRGTEAGRNKLSMERARSVAEYLLSKNAILPERSIYEGRGDKDPVAPNTTPEGMKKNRRVEIYLLEE